METVKNIQQKWYSHIPKYNKMRNQVYWALNFFHFVNDAIVFLIPTLMATFYDAFNLSLSQTSMVLAFNMGAIVVFQVFNGYLVDKGKEKFLYLFGLPFMTVSVFLLLLAKDFTSLLILSTINGIGLSFVHAIVYTMGLKLFSERKEENQSNMAAFGDLGKILGIVSTAVLITLFSEGWRISLIVWGIIAAIIYGCALFIVPKFPFDELNKNLKLKELSTSKEKKEEKEDISEKEKKKTLILLFLIFFLYTASNELVVKTYTVFFRVRRTGASSDFAEYLYLFLVLAGTIGVFLSGRVKARYGFHKLLNFLYLGQIPTMALFLILDKDELFSDIIFSLFIGFFYLSVYISIQSEISFHLSFKKIGFGYAALLSFGWTGGFLFQLIAGFIADVYGELTFFVISIILACIVITLIQFIPKRTPTKILNGEK